MWHGVRYRLPIAIGNDRRGRPVVVVVRTTKRGWFPRTAPPAGGLRAVRSPGPRRPEAFPRSSSPPETLRSAAREIGEDLAGPFATSLVSSSAKAARFLPCGPFFAP